MRETLRAQHTDSGLAVALRQVADPYVYGAEHERGPAIASVLTLQPPRPVPSAHDALPMPLSACKLWCSAIELVQIGRMGASLPRKQITPKDRRMGLASSQRAAVMMRTVRGAFQEAQLAPDLGMICATASHASISQS